MLHLWWHAGGHYRGGQEAGRATNQQSSHRVRPWNSRIGVEECSKGSTLWKLCRIRKTQESKRLFEFRKEAQLRKDRGALPRVRAASNTHARTGTHAIRHGIMWQNSKVTNGFTSRLLTNGLATEANTRSFNPMNEEAATPEITKEHLEHNQVVQWNMREKQWSLLSSWTWSLSSRSSMVGFFVITNMATITRTNHS